MDLNVPLGLIQYTDPCQKFCNLVDQVLLGLLYRVFHNALREIKLKYCQQGLLFGLKKGHVHVPQVGGFVFLPLEWRLNLEDSLHSLQRVKTEVQNCAFFW